MPARKRPSQPQPTRSKKAETDPAPVAEVRAIRRQMWKEAGGDINELMNIAEREVQRQPKTKTSARGRKKPAA